MATAQSSPPAANPGQTAGAARADEITLDVVVRDRHGHPIRDLRPEEVQITDDGDTVKVTRLQAGAARGSLFVALVFDNLDAVSARLARDAALEMLKQNPGGDTSFAVWRIHERFHLVQAFTTDREALRRAVETVTALATHPKGAEAGPVSGPAVEIARSSERIVRDEHFRACPSRLLALTRHLGQTPGRKTILYFSDGIDVTATTPEQLRAMIGSANRAGVSIYALDVSGLTRTAQIAAFGPVMPDTPKNAPVPTAEDVAPETAATKAANAPAEDRRPPLRRLAETTGGLYIDQWTDFRAHIERIAEDMTSYYEASYTPAGGEYDGRFRAVTVKTSRRNAQVQARAGYFSLPPNAGMDVRPFEVALLKALSSPERTETLPFRGQVLRFGWKAEKTQAELVVEVPLKSFACAEDKDSRICKSHFSVLALVKDGQGQVVEKFSQDRPSQMTAAGPAGGQTNYYTFQRPFEIAPGEYRMDIAVADRLARKVSSRTIPFTVLERPAGVALSDLSLVRRLEPVNLEGNDGEPLDYQRRQVIPDLTAQFQPGSHDIPVFVALYPDVASSDKPQLELALLRDKELIARMSGRLPEGTAGGALPFMTSMKGSALAPGGYQLVAKATQAGKTSEQIVSFEVTGSGSSVAASAPGSVFENGPEVLRNAQKPDDAEIKRILDGVRQRALDYKNDLTNFACIEVTRRAVDPSGTGDWKAKDSITEVLQYMDGAENTQLLEVNGSPAKGTNNSGARVYGEFGGLFDLVFSEQVGAQIEWQDVTDWKGARVNVFQYHVPAARSRYRVIPVSGSKSLLTAYKGLVYIDASTLSVRRISVQAEDLPKDFPIHRSEITVDYDWVRISGHDYLLPQTTTLYVGSGKHYLMKTEKEFRDFRRYDVGAEWQSATPATP
ncbi:MAG: VWA domain-containing protein [Bryobacteraceae bacterium]